LPQQQQALIPLELTEIVLQGYVLTELGAWLPEINRELKRAGSQVYRFYHPCLPIIEKPPQEFLFFISNLSQKPSLTSKHLQQKFILLLCPKKCMLIIFSPANE